MWFREISKGKGEGGGGRGRPPRKTNRTKPKSWIIYTFKSCCLILQQVGEMRCSQPSIQSVPPLLGMRSEAGGDPGLRTSPKQRTTQKLRPVLPGHPGMLCRAGRSDVSRREHKWGRERKRNVRHTYGSFQGLDYSCQGTRLCDCVCVCENGWADGWLPSLMLGRGQTDLTQGWKVLEVMVGSRVSMGLSYLVRSHMDR